MFSERGLLMKQSSCSVGVVFVNATIFFVCFVAFSRSRICRSGDSDVSEADGVFAGLHALSIHSLIVVLSRRHLCLLLVGSSVVFLEIETWSDMFSKPCNVVGAWLCKFVKV